MQQVLCRAAGGDHLIGLEGLLVVECALRRAFRPPSLTADGNEDAIAHSMRREEIKGAHGCSARFRGECTCRIICQLRPGSHLYSAALFPHPSDLLRQAAREQECPGNKCVAVGKLRLEPLPVTVALRLPGGEQLLREEAHEAGERLLTHRVARGEATLRRTGRLAESGTHERERRRAEQRVRLRLDEVQPPRLRQCRPQHREQRRAQSRGQRWNRTRRTESPDAAAERVLRADRVEPMPVIAEEIMEPPVRQLRIAQKARIASRRVKVAPFLSPRVELRREQQRPRVVVG